MTDDTGYHGDGCETEEQPSAREIADRKRLTRTRRLVGAAMLAFLAAGAYLAFNTGLLRKLEAEPAKAEPAAAPLHPVQLDSLPTVQAVWEELDIDAMPAEVAQNLKIGRFCYDNRFPGNFGMAIGYWKQGLALLAGAGRSRVETLVASAERELARQFTADSGDAIVLLKQGKREDAVVMLERMRADYLDVNAPQYAWASQMLSRRRR